MRFANATLVVIAWRMTGDGDLRMGIDGPHGDARELTWGPELHGGSNFARPGQEWGTGFVADAPGCWHLNLSRSVHGAADVWLDVLP